MSDVVHVIRASVDPTSAPTREGQHWINTVTNITWLSVGISTVADWILVNDSLKVKVSNTDTTGAFLASKLAAGTGIAFNTLNPGANEVIEISAPGSTTDEKVKVSATDTTAGYLNSEVTISNGTNTTSPLEKSITSPGGDEKLNIKFDQTKLAIPSTQITDFTEAVQDVMGGALVDSTSIDFQYNDIANTQAAVVLPAGVDHNALQNWVANKHIDHSAVSINAGTGLTGGGDITANRTLAMANTSVTASAYGSATQVPTFTVNAQGQLTLASNATIAIPSTQVTDFAEAVDDRVAALIVAGTGITATYNDPLNTLTIASTITQYTDENAQDAIGAALIASTNISPTYNDALNQISNDLTNTTVVAAAYGSTTQVGAFTVDSKGRLTAASNTTIAIPSTQVTDFAEAAQDAVGGILTDTTSIDFTYNDAGNQITAVVLPAGVNHDLLLNGGGNRHIDHSTVSITAGAGLTGGGDITANRTLAMPNIGTPGTYGNTTNFPIITTDAQGRVTNVTTTPADANWIVKTDIDPGGLLTWSDKTGQDLCIRQANNGIGSSYIRQVNSRGTLAVPTPMLNGDRIGGNGYYGWNSGGANGWPSIAFNGYATENHTPTAQGGELRIEVIPNGGTNPVVTSIFRQNGDWDIAGAIQIGTTADNTNGGLRYTGTEFQVREAGIWNIVSNKPTSLSATGAVATTSSTFTTVGAMTSTPAAGTYMIHFTAAYAVSVSSTTGDFGLFIGGVEQAVCRRTVSSVSTTTLSGSVAISTMVTVNGSQVLDIQFKENASGTLTVNAREMLIIPISR